MQFILKLLLTISLFCFNLVCFAQDSQSSKTDNEAKKEITTVGKVNLVQPKYPREAVINRISGTVVVRITVDENGNVTSAKAETGDASLHKAAEEAALQSKFPQSIQDGKPIKINGTIAFQFNLFDDWETVGQNLGRLENKYGYKGNNKYSFDINWQGFEEEEAEYYSLLKDKFRETQSKRAANLIKAIEKKLQFLNPTELWYFKLGITISKLNVTISLNIKNEDENFQKYFKELEALLKTVPNDVSKERLNVLQNVAEYAKKNNLTETDRIEIVRLLVESYNQKLLTK